MCGAHAEAHHEAMFNSYEMTRAFVAERQETLRHEARQHHLGRGRRRRQRPAGPVVRPAPRHVATTPAASGDEGRLAA